MICGLLGSTASERICSCCRVAACHAPEAKMPDERAHADRMMASNDNNGHNWRGNLDCRTFCMIHILQQQVHLNAETALARQAIHQPGGSNIFERDANPFVKSYLLG